jgi:hypothetical protein
MMRPRVGYDDIAGFGGVAGYGFLGIKVQDEEGYTHVAMFAVVLFCQFGFSEGKMARNMKMIVVLSRRNSISANKHENVDLYTGMRI